MKVICLYNQGVYLPDDLVFDGSSRSKESDFPLKIGKKYNVYAMTINDNYAWYYLCNENFCYYPVWSPSPLFQVYDSRLSRYWVFSYKKGKDYVRARAMWAFPEWAEDPDYYDKLTDGFENEVNIFKRYREKMDLEFADSSVLAIAKIGDEEWLLCPYCLDAWKEKNSVDALVKCGNCQKISNNPRYKNEFPHF